MYFLWILKCDLLISTFVFEHFIFSHKGVDKVNAKKIKNKLHLRKKLNIKCLRSNIIFYFIFHTILMWQRSLTEQPAHVVSHCDEWGFCFHQQLHLCRSRALISSSLSLLKLQPPQLWQEGLNLMCFWGHLFDYEEKNFQQSLDWMFSWSC